MEKIKVLDKRIITDYIAYYPDLDTLDGDQNQPFIDDYFRRAEPYTQIIHGITYRFYPKAFINSRKIAVEYMVFQISAKMLKHKYFDGINKENIKQICEDINKFGVIKVELKDFLNGLVSDIDICINQLIGLKPLKIAFSFISHYALHGKKPLINFFNEQFKVNQKNIGVEFNKREKATNTNPYCKIYHKGFELETKSHDFYRQFLEPMRKHHLSNLVRYEFTIKAHKHKKYLQEQGFKAEFKTLNDLLAIPSAELTSIAKSGLKHYLEKKEQSRIKSDELTPMDVMLSYYIEELIKAGYDIEKLLGFQYLLEDKPVQKSQCKSKAKKLIDNIISVDNNQKKKLENNNEAQSFLKNIGF